MLDIRRALVFGTIILTVLLQFRIGYAMVPLPLRQLPLGFVEATGLHGTTVLVGPLQVSSTGGYEREVIIHDQPPFMVSTEAGVTPQEIANTYG
jgi:hypothetical protein